MSSAFPGSRYKSSNVAGARFTRDISNPPGKLLVIPPASNSHPIIDRLVQSCLDKLPPELDNQGKWARICDFGSWHLRGSAVAECIPRLQAGTVRPGNRAAA